MGEKRQPLEAVVQVNDEHAPPAPLYVGVAASNSFVCQWLGGQTRGIHLESPVQDLSIAVEAGLALLAVAISIGHYLKRKRVLWIGGAGAALLLGVLVGVFVRLANTAPSVTSWMVFQSDFFFLVLLPPIMFEACFNLDARLFIKNIGSVCALAFAGTTISTFAVGLNMWVAGKLKLCFGLSISEALAFGALISATDPVTVLAIFNALGAQPDLYMNVFGESVLNDAVAMVLFQTFTSFAVHEVAVSAGSVAQGIATFFGIFLGSTALGIALGFAAAALLKSRWYYGDVNMETGLMLLIGYGSYMAGAASGLSGIVCVMFCAMVAQGYAAPNLSPGGLQATRGIYAVLSSCMEQFVFVYIGVSLFMEPQEWHCIAFTAVCLFGLAWSRAANILPCCSAVNLLRPPELAVTTKQQLLLWWSGLRGAMAFALSVEAEKRFGAAGKLMMTCTFMVILLTVLVNGGSTAYLLAWCGLLQGDKDNMVPATAAAHQQQQQQQQFDFSCRDATNDDGSVGAGRDEQQLLLKVLQKGNGLPGPYSSDAGECTQLLLHEKLSSKLQERSQQQQQQQRQQQRQRINVFAGELQCKDDDSECTELTSSQQLLSVKPASVAVAVSGAESSRPPAHPAAGAGSKIASAASLQRGHSFTAPYPRRRSSGNGAASTEQAAAPDPFTSGTSQQSAAAVAVAVAAACNDGSTLKTETCQLASQHCNRHGPCGSTGGLQRSLSPALNMLEMLRNNNHQLQARLDRWDAQLLQPWFINPVSAREHGRWQQLQLQLQQGMQ